MLRDIFVDLQKLQLNDRSYSPSWSYQPTPDRCYYFLKKQHVNVWNPASLLILSLDTRNTVQINIPPKLMIDSMVESCRPQDKRL
jgi:hypothetical protein